MSTAEVTREQPSRSSAEISAQTSEVLIKLSIQARALQVPTLVCAVTSIAGAFLTWVLSYASYIADSAASTLVCLLLLVALVVPGAFLGWVYVSLRRVTQLPRRFNLPAREIPTGEYAPAPDSSDSRFARIFERLRQRTVAALDVWSRVEYSEGIKSVGGPRWFIALLAMPASEIIVAAALLANAAVVIVAVYTILGSLLGLVF